MSRFSRFAALVLLPFFSMALVTGCGNSQAEQSAAQTDDAGSTSDAKADEGKAQPKTAQADRAAPTSDANAGESQAQPENAGNSEAEAALRKDLKDAISVLEKGDVAGFIENYMPLEHVNHIRKFTTVEKIAESIKQGGLFEEAWLEKLQAMQKGKVEFLDEEKSRAVFQIETGKKEPAMDGLLPNPAREKIPKTPGFSGDVTAAISAAIKTLEAGDHKKFIENMFPPAELYITQSEDGMKSLLAKLEDHPEMVKQMLADFKALENLTPEMNAEKTKATFDLGGRPVIFEKAGTWRFANTAKEIRTEMYEQSKRSPMGASGLKRIEWIRIRDNWRLTQAD